MGRMASAWIAPRGTGALARTVEASWAAAPDSPPETAEPPALEARWTAVRPEEGAAESREIRPATVAEQATSEQPVTPIPDSALRYKPSETRGTPAATGR